jgi:hypothetical protein
MVPAMVTRTTGNPSHLWRDMARDWRRWSRAERVAAPLLLGGLIAATMPVLWLIAQ